MEKLKNVQLREKRDQGIGATEAFKGKSESRAVCELYGESAQQFADILREKLGDDLNNSIADLGAFKGELVGETIKHLPEYDFRVIAVDSNQEALAENQIAAEKIQANLTELPLKDTSVDVAIMRYALQWNSIEDQKRILKEVSRIVKKFAIIQHAGSENDASDEWRKKVQRIFNSGELPQLKRGTMHFSSRNEVERMLFDLGIKFERVDEKVIEGLSSVYCEKYNLDQSKCDMLKDLMEDKDFIVRTTWIIYR